MKIAYVHQLPLEYYPPATNFLDLLGRRGMDDVWVYSTVNRKKRTPYRNRSIKIMRGASPDPGANPLKRLWVSIWWHIQTARALSNFNPDAVLYVEPHSAIGIWIYYKIFRGKARLFIHHHEYYEKQDFYRPGMRLPRLGSRLEHRFLFRRAEWVSQTNRDRLHLVKSDFPDVPESTWRLLPNYPPEQWAGSIHQNRDKPNLKPLRIVYVGSASFEDTYIEEIVQWVAANTSKAQLHICGYNISSKVWDWLVAKSFPNVSFDSDGYSYEELPGLLEGFEVGLVLYKGNTTNFIYNVPNKVFEYLRCGLEVWYPKEMKSIRKFEADHSDAPFREVDFSEIDQWHPKDLRKGAVNSFNTSRYTAERAFEPLFISLGLGLSPSEP